MTGTTYSLLFKSYAYLTENYMQKRFPIIDVNTRLIEEKYGNAQLSSMDVVALLQGLQKQDLNRQQISQSLYLIIFSLA